MITCPNCAWRNSEGSRFCENCGADLEALNRGVDKPVSTWPQQPHISELQDAGEVEPSAPEWRMAPLPAEEPVHQKRRLWVWFLIIALLGCLAVCVVSFTWLEHTDSGRHFQTRVSEEQTTQAGK